MHGEICALFYRFKSVGGFEYVADLLIGPRRGGSSLGTHPGDSGTLWLIEAPDAKSRPTPVALQWGGQVFTDAAGLASSYALATLLSTVCNKLDVDAAAGLADGTARVLGRGRALQHRHQGDQQDPQRKAQAADERQSRAHLVSRPPTSTRRTWRA